MLGECPEQIDHINGDKKDNRWINLRESNPSHNAKNAKKRLDNQSGVTGVHFHKKSNKWTAQIQIHNKGIHIGLFCTKDDAIAARKQAEQKHNFSITHGRD
jgi:hypothetical protein